MRWLATLLCSTCGLWAQDPSLDSDARAAMRWFDGLGHVDAASRPLVRFSTGMWRRSGNGPPENTFGHGFLLADDGRTFGVLTLDLQREELTRTGAGVPDHEKIAAEVVPLRDHAARLLEVLAAADKRKIQKMLRRFGRPRVYHGLGTELFVYAWACQHAGDEALAQQLVEQALRAYAASGRGGGPDVRVPLAADMAHAGMWQLIQAFADPAVGYPELRARCRRWLERYPDSEHAERASAIAAKLEAMSGERAPLPADSAEALVFALRDQNGRQWSQPGACDIFLDPRGERSPAHRLRAMGFDAVPALIAALENDAFTRSVGFHRNFYFSHRVLRVKECAVAILADIAAASFHRNNDAATRRAVEEWWRGVRVRGEFAVLAERCGRNPAMAARLLRKFPDRAFEPIAGGLEQAPNAHARAQLVALLARVEGDRSTTLLRSELRRGPHPRARVAAALALFLRGEIDPAVAAVIDVWRVGGEDTHGAGLFLASCGRAAAIAALAARRDALGADVLRALAGGEQWFHASSTPDRGSPRLVLAEASPEAEGAIEALALELLDSGREFRGSFGNTTNPRVADFAAAALAARWPDRYRFDFGAPRRLRDRQLRVLRNVRRAARGEPLLPEPQRPRIAPVAPASIDPLFARLDRLRDEEARRGVLARIEALGLGALPAVLQRSASRSRADLNRLARRLASHVRVVRPASGSEPHSPELAARLRGLVGRALRPSRVVDLLVEFAEEPPDGVRAIALVIDREGDGAGVELTVGLAPGVAPPRGQGSVGISTSVSAADRNLYNSTGTALRSMATKQTYYEDFAEALMCALEAPPEAPIDARYALGLRR